MENERSRRSGTLPASRRQVREVQRNEQHVEKLRRLLNRFKKSELITDVPDICKLSLNSEEYAMSLGKDQIVDRLTSIIQNQITNLEDVIPIIQLKYLQNHARSRTWSALKVENASKLVTENEELQDFMETLEKILNRSEFFCKVFSSFWQGALWTVVIFNQQGLMQDFYLIHCAHSPLVMYCSLRVSHKELLFRALLQVHRGTGIHHYSIKGRDIYSLLRMCIQKSTKRFDPSAFPPVVQKSLKKREEEKTEKLPRNVVDEDRKDLLLRKKYLKEHFNSYELPCLESLSYAIKTQYFGAPDEEEIPDSHCTVRFKGQNVLEGVHTMVMMRQTACPLPDFLSKVPVLGSNSFLVTQKKRNDLNSRTPHV